jgi:hypothetical protein
MQKAAVSFVMCVCPSVRIKLGSSWTDYRDTLHCTGLLISADKIQVRSKSDKNNRNLDEHLRVFMITHHHWSS